jgi:hypothetical protein
MLFCCPALWLPSVIDHRFRAARSRMLLWPRARVVTTPDSFPRAWDQWRKIGVNQEETEDYEPTIVIILDHTPSLF